MRAASPRKRAKAERASGSASVARASRSRSPRMSSKMARTSASLVGNRRYSVPLPTPAARDLLHADVEPGFGELRARRVEDAGAVASGVGWQGPAGGVHRGRSYPRARRAQEV